MSRGPQAGHPRRPLPRREQHDRVERPRVRQPDRVRLVRPPGADRRAGPLRLLLPRRGPAPARAARPHPRPRRRRAARHAHVLAALAARHHPPRPGRHAQRHVPRALRAGPPAGDARPPLRRPGGVERRHVVRRLHRRELPPRRLPRLRRPLRARRRVHPRRRGAVGLVGRRRVVADAAGRCSCARSAGAFAVHGGTSTSPATSACPAARSATRSSSRPATATAGRELAAATADAIFSRHSKLAAAQAFYADVKGRLARYGRSPRRAEDHPGGHVRARRHAPTEADEKARHIRRQQVSPQTAILLLEQVWNRDLSAYDAEGPLPDDRPRRVGAASIIQGRARMYADPLETAAEWRAARRGRGT